MKTAAFANAAPANRFGPQAAQNGQFPQAMDPFQQQGGFNPQMMQALFKMIMSQLMPKVQGGQLPQGAVKGCQQCQANGKPWQRPRGAEGRQLGQGLKGMNKGLHNKLRGILKNGFNGPQPRQPVQGLPKGANAAPVQGLPKGANAAPVQGLPKGANAAPANAAPANAAPFNAANGAPQNAQQVKGWPAKHGGYAWDKTDKNKFTINKGQYKGAQGHFDPNTKTSYFNHGGKDFQFKDKKGRTRRW